MNISKSVMPRCSERNRDEVFGENQQNNLPAWLDPRGNGREDKAPKSNPARRAWHALE
jgi:hypothetical protein